MVYVWYLRYICESLMLFMKITTIAWQYWVY